MSSRRHRSVREVQGVALNAGRAQQPGAAARRTDGPAGKAPARASRTIGLCGAGPASTDACRAPEPNGRAHLAYGTVIYAEVPFWDGTANTKRRPAMVVHVDGETLLVCPITSNSGWYRRIGAYPRLVFWGEAGLARPSFLVPYLVSVDHTAVLNVKGRLHDADLQMVGRQHLVPALPPGSRTSQEEA